MKTTEDKEEVITPEVVTEKSQEKKNDNTTLWIALAALVALMLFMFWINSQNQIAENEDNGRNID